MSELARQLIEENLKTKNPVLDLGNCGLDGTEDKLYSLLTNADHLETIYLSNWNSEFSEEKYEWTGWYGPYRWQKNMIIQIPSALPKKLKKLVVVGGPYDYNERNETMPKYHFKSSFIRNHVNNELVETTTTSSISVNIQEIRNYFSDSRNKQLKNISALKYLEQLQYLDLRSNLLQDQDISVLKELTQLKYLVLNDNQLINVSFLKYMKQLQHLHLNDNYYIQDITTLKYLKQLQYLDFGKNLLQDIFILKGLKQLRYLNLCYSFLHYQDISVLKDLKHLRYLNLSNCYLQGQDISFLKNLRQLHHLDLSGNEIQS